MKKINIPIVAVVAVRAMGNNYNATKSIYRVGPMYFRKWFSHFFTECYEDYRQYCSSGSIKKEKTLKRIEIMENSLVDYFELNDINEQIVDSLTEETTSTKDNLSENSSYDSDIQEECESSSENESSKSTENVEMPLEEMLEENKTA